LDPWKKKELKVLNKMSFTPPMFLAQFCTCANGLNFNLLFCSLLVYLFGSICQKKWAKNAGQLFCHGKQTRPDYLPCIFKYAAASEQGNMVARSSITVPLHLPPEHHNMQQPAASEQENIK
jgi:hypothetical protein